MFLFMVSDREILMRDGTPRIEFITKYFASRSSNSTGSSVLPKDNTYSNSNLTKNKLEEPDIFENSSLLYEVMETGVYPD